MRGLIIVLLIVGNGLVLLGQLWPEAAPPFAREVNILVLAATLVFLLSALVMGPPKSR